MVRRSPVGNTVYSPSFIVWLCGADLGFSSISDGRGLSQANRLYFCFLKNILPAVSEVCEVFQFCDFKQICCRLPKYQIYGEKFERSFKL